MSATPRAKGRPPAEKKTPSGPIVTPQVLGIIFGIILLVGVIVYYQTVIKKSTDEIANLESRINAKKQEISTYQKKGKLKDTADELNKTIRAKLDSLGYLFLEDQQSVLPFWEQTMFPLLFSGRLSFTSDTEIDVEEYRFKLNMAMEPFQTLPRSVFFEDAVNLFPIDYDPERDGVPTDSPLDTRPSSFLQPYNISLKNFRGTYEDCKDFIERLQTLRRDKLITVHCLVNDEDSTSGLFRSSTDWSFEITVYFMNPEAPATGTTPPDAPGSHSC